MVGYQTEQRRLLYSFLTAHPDEQFSAREIADVLSGHSISLSAVYRNLAAMVDEGLINRVTKYGSRESFYQFIQSEECQNALHLICTECGKTFHMSRLLDEWLIHSLSQSDGFQLNKTKTILYGVCQNCGSK